MVGEYKAEDKLARIIGLNIVEEMTYRTHMPAYQVAAFRLSVEALLTSLEAGNDVIACLPEHGFDVCYNNAYDGYIISFDIHGGFYGGYVGGEYYINIRHGIRAKCSKKYVVKALVNSFIAKSLKLSAADIRVMFDEI